MSVGWGGTRDHSIDHGTAVCFIRVGCLKEGGVLVVGAFGGEGPESVEVPLKPRLYGRVGEVGHGRDRDSLGCTEEGPLEFPNHVIRRRYASGRRSTGSQQPHDLRSSHGVYAQEFLYVHVSCGP